MQISVNNADNYIDLRYADLNLEGVTQAHQPNIVENPLALNQYKALEERLKVMEGYDAFNVDALEMVLVPYVVIPSKFKVHDFGKYKGLACPRNHLHMHCQKMHAYA